MGPNKTRPYSGDGGGDVHVRCVKPPPPTTITTATTIYTFCARDFLQQICDMWRSPWWCMQSKSLPTTGVWLSSLLGHQTEHVVCVVLWIEWGPGWVCLYMFVQLKPICFAYSTTPWRIYAAAHNILVSIGESKSKRDDVTPALWMGLCWGSCPYGKFDGCFWCVYALLCWCAVWKLYSIISHRVYKVVFGYLYVYGQV